MAEAIIPVCLLLVVDESPASRQAVDYVAKLVGRRRGFRVLLMHLLPPLPPELLEFGGAEDPRMEQRLQAQLHDQQEEWITSQVRTVRPALDLAQIALRKAGVSTQEMEFKFSDPKDKRDPADAILKIAHAQGCRTIVVAHESHSWFRELFGGHLAEELLRKAKGLTLWVVENDGGRGGREP